MNVIRSIAVALVSITIILLYGLGRVLGLPKMFLSAHCLSVAEEKQQVCERIEQSLLGLLVC